MKNFTVIYLNQTKNKFQEATYIFLVNYMSNKDETANLIKNFKAIDKNGDG